MIETIKNDIAFVVNKFVTARSEYKRKVAENHKELIRGYVLDPDNHPSYK